MIAKETLAFLYEGVVIRAVVFLMTTDPAGGDAAAFNENTFPGFIETRKVHEQLFVCCKSCGAVGAGLIKFTCLTVPSRTDVLILPPTHPHLVFWFAASSHVN